MLPKKSGTIIYLLVLLLTFAAFPVDNNSLPNNRKTLEKQVEENYIMQDALLTTNMQMNQIISKLKLHLETINDTNIEQQLNMIKKIYPEVVDITPLKQKGLGFLESNYPLTDYLKPYNFRDSLNEGNGDVNLTISTGNNRKYQILMRTNLFNEIKKKQEVRMFTISFIQNNRWKTVPTKYQPKKKLSQGLDTNLPDLENATNEKGLSHYIENELVIKFKPFTDENYITKLTNKYKINIKKRRDNTIIAHCEDKPTKELIVLLEKEQEQNNKIDYIEPHFVYLTNKVNNKLFIPNDILYQEYQWNLPSISTEQGWKITKGKENIIIAVIDTGVDLEHPEFQNRLVKGVNIIEPKQSPLDDDGHGTHVAGIISANTNNNEGIAGITWYNKIMPIKVLDQSGAGTLFDVAEGIIWATDNGAKVINLSLGNYAQSKYLHDAVKYAYSKDVVLIAATGNDNTNEFGYPAAYEEVLGISATDPYQNRAPFSNYGDYVDVVAPGVNIPSTYPGNQYAALSGTSMASPHVAALAGLIRSINPSLKNYEVVDIIRSTASDLGTPGRDKYFGYGEINIEKAITKSVPQITNKSIYLQRLLQLFK